MRRQFPGLRKIIILLGDLFLLVVAAYASFYIVFATDPPVPGLNSFYALTPVMIIAGAVLLNINGLLSLARKTFGQIALSLAVTIFQQFILIMAISYFMREFAYPRSVLLLTIFVQFAFLIVWKYAFWRAEQVLVRSNNVLVIGGQKECTRIVRRLVSLSHSNYKVKYVCTDWTREPWAKVEADINLVIIASDIQLQDKAKILNFCRSKGKQVFFVPDIYELLFFNIELDKIDDIPMFRTGYLKPSLEQRILKRILDLVVASIALICLGPLLLIVAIAIKASGTGPVFYSQTRTGQDEREFTLYKFRSMIPDAETATGPVFAADQDPRITTLGRFMRATRLDELPQLFNVLRGDMSIVGPRPERPFFVEQFKAEIPGYVYRHHVKPGITGMAQVQGKYNTAPSDKLAYDLIYIQRCSVLTDLVVMLQTVQVLLTKSSTEGQKKVQRMTEWKSYNITHIN